MLISMGKIIFKTIGDFNIVGENIYVEVF